jgi:hypothetical protein
VILVDLAQHLTAFFVSSLSTSVNSEVEKEKLLPIVLKSLISLAKGKMFGLMEAKEVAEG